MSSCAGVSPALTAISYWRSATVKRRKAPVERSAISSVYRLEGIDFELKGSSKTVPQPYVYGQGKIPGLLAIPLHFDRAAGREVHAVSSAHARTDGVYFG